MDIPHKILSPALVLVAIVYGLSGFTSDDSAPVSGGLVNYLDDSGDMISPLPKRVALDPDEVALGRILFADTRLSGSGVSCNTCHNLSNSGIDKRRFSINLLGGQDDTNTPTVFNVGFNQYYLWSGIEATLEDQIEGVINNPKHMNSNWATVLKNLASDSDLVTSFSKLYADGMTADNIKHAIAEFERSLITPNAPLDNYLRGDKTALSERQKQGYKLFRTYGCISCHQGTNIGGNLLQRMGIFADPFAEQKHLTKSDLGRYAITGLEQDRFVFRVPNLRNVELTPPYFHNGSTETLEKAVEIMAFYQLGRKISQDDRDLIVEFLYSLTGKYEGDAQ